MASTPVLHVADLLATTALIRHQTGNARAEFVSYNLLIFSGCELLFAIVRLCRKSRSAEMLAS